MLMSSFLKGWECSAGCSTENGFCEKPGKCRCKPGWQGDNCDHCVPFPGCLHGTCEKAWQCICEEGWVGSLCDQDIRLCSSRPCAINATCIETGEGRYLCVCPPGFSGENCHRRRGLCLTNGSPCQNGGTCMDAEGSAAFSSCLCPPGFSGDFCEIGIDSCQPNPCLNGGNCTNHGLTFTCVCPHGFTGFTCNDTTSLSPCAGRPCANEGPTCSLLLALLTCLVILGTTGIVFFGRCETWLANAKYSQLVRQQKEHLLREAGSTSQEEAEHSVNIILPEKIRLTSFGRHYTSI
uniref:Protein delta homolog 1 n=1 Tax=Neolamprologus brichardi TaxID=32507 RepID=A0A3Q4NBJ1_NEOBR